VGESLQVAEQDYPLPRRQPGSILPGYSGNPRGRISAAEKRKRLADKVAELASELGGLDAISPSQRLLIERAAMLSFQKPTSHNDSVRISNSIERALRRARRGTPRGTRVVR
jgi:hypothetical protein